MTRTTKAELDQLMVVLNNRLGRPVEWGKPGNLSLQEAYGNGPRMYECLGLDRGENEVSPRLPRGQMEQWIRAMLQGIEYAETNIGGYDSLPRWDEGQPVQERPVVDFTTEPGSPERKASVRAAMRARGPRDSWAE